MCSFHPRRNRNGSLDDGKDYEEFLVPKSVPVVLEAAPITAAEALQLRFYTDYQWLMDFAIHAVMVYTITEAYLHFFPGREEINLSLVWCLLVLGFATYPLFRVPCGCAYLSRRTLYALAVA
ncbi:hypothetical protein HPB48_004774 [Haemaphysalis longicornis]|uniref:Uncharacterized protein n=1 Tax=Haemaphysalis longicornis TaxID=44386 RepID=A0A9J6G158_HAELO|nr:hypothetical protein HPB48_004774 [Haemaphysalis longicornis]